MTSINKNKKIIVTGGNGRFAQVLKKENNKLNIFFPSKKIFNILDINLMKKYIQKIKPKYIIHCAGLSRPMDLHVKDISKSINLNIIGTANVVNLCNEFDIKLIYFSTGYVYEGKKGNYSEKDPVLPINNYAWSKLGGESSVILYKKSLILRIMMCEKPFIHDHAFYDVKTNFMFHDEVAKIIPKILDKKGIINVGGKIQSVFNFAKKTKKNVIKSSGKKIFPPNPSMNVSKLKKILS
ncbi:sugar nucleotide-binding protein [Alphaproteobacteria bacterium]|nr:sugar nucleotide-binding protein [Alphaproteobacteria bacterium]